jgi:hypothetical protein
VEEAQATVVVVVVRVTDVELDELALDVCATAGAASIVNDDTKSTRSVAIEAVFFDI